MNESTSVKMHKAVVYSAATTTAIAGILHLRLVPNVIDFNMNTGVFFLVGGILQLLWVLPIVREWGKLWYYVGIGGTAILIIMWAITRVPNPITGRGGSINEMSITIEVFQVAFIGLTAMIIAKTNK
jgi:hypothetical protein